MNPKAALSRRRSDHHLWSGLLRAGEWSETTSPKETYPL